MQVPPVIGTDAGRIDPQRLHAVDRLQHAPYLRPAALAQQTLTTGAHERHGLAGFLSPDRPHDVDAGHHGAEIVRNPADEGEHAVRGEAPQPAPTLQNALLDRVPKPDPVLDTLLDPRQFN